MNDTRLSIRAECSEIVVARKVLGRPHLLYLFHDARRPAGVKIEARILPIPKICASLRMKTNRRSQNVTEKLMAKQSQSKSNIKFWNTITANSESDEWV